MCKKWLLVVFFLQIFIIFSGFAYDLPNSTAIDFGLSELIDVTQTFSCFQKNKPSLSFGIADLKFDGEKIKICEFGQGIFSTFKGYDALYSKGKIWSLAWDFLKQFQLPVWVVSAFHGKDKELLALGALGRCGGKFFTNVQSLEKDATFRLLDRKKDIPRKKNCIADYVGLVIMRRSWQNTQAFMKRHPNFLVIDEESAPFVGNKYMTHLLFEDDEFLSQFRPRCLVCSKKRCKVQAQIIKRSFKSSLCVIKPIGSSMGRGIIIAEKQQASEILSLVFSEKKLPDDMQDPAYDFLRHDRNDIFLVEEFASSKLVNVDGEWYDPTMRVVFFVTCEKDLAKVTFLDAYWKLPGYSLSDDVSLTDMHKSHVVKGARSSCLVEPEDFKKVTKILDDVLLKVFSKMQAPKIRAFWTRLFHGE